MPPFCSVLAHFLAVIVLVHGSFYCKNPGYPCLNGGICQYNGECQCKSGFQGYNCGLDSTTMSSSTACTVECLNKGICYSLNKCYCTKDYMGAVCDQAYDTALCSKADMTIQAFRPQEFTGEIFLMQSMTNCKLAEVTPSTIAGYKQYELTVPHSNPGGPCQLRKTMNKTTGEVKFDVDVATSHRLGQFGMYDGLKTVSCLYEADKHAAVMDATDPQYPVQLTVVDNNGDPVQGQVNSQDPMFLVFEAQNMPVGKTGVRVVSLEAYSIAPISKEVRRITLLNDECKTFHAEELGYSVSNDMEMNAAGTMWNAKVHMKAIPIIENEPMYFNYRVKFCKSKCRERSCASIGPKRLPKHSFKHRMEPIIVP